MNYEKCLSIRICVYNITHKKILTDSEDSECLSTSDINSDDLLDTPNTSDMKSSDDDLTSTSSCSNFSVRLCYLNFQILSY